MIIEVSILSGALLLIAIIVTAGWAFWSHRKYPKPIPPPPIEMDTQAFMRKFLEFEEKFKAFERDYTGNEYISPFLRGPNS